MAKSAASYFSHIKKSPTTIIYTNIENAEINESDPKDHIIEQTPESEQNLQPSETTLNTSEDQQTQPNNNEINEESTNNDNPPDKPSDDNKPPLDHPLNPENNNEFLSSRSYEFIPLNSERNFPLSKDLKEQPLNGFMSAGKISQHCRKITEYIIAWIESLPSFKIHIPELSDVEPPQNIWLNGFIELLEEEFSEAESMHLKYPDMELIERYNLNPTEATLLWIIVAINMKPAVREALIAAAPAVILPHAYTALCLDMLCSNQFESQMCTLYLSPSMPLVASGLISIVTNKYPTQPLFFELLAHESLTYHFTGLRALTSKLAPICELHTPELFDESFQTDKTQKTTNIVANFFTRPALSLLERLDKHNLAAKPSLAFCIEGVPGSGRNTFMKIIASNVRKRIISVHSAPLLTYTIENFNEFIETLFIEAEISGDIICFREASTLFSEDRISSAIAIQLSRRAVCTAFCIDLTQQTPAILDPYILMRIKLEANLRHAAATYWKHHLDFPFINDKNVNIQDLTDKLSLLPYQIQKAAKLAYLSNDDIVQNAIELKNEFIEHAATSQVTKNIGGLAFVSEPEVDLSEVIVDKDISIKINQIIGSARQRKKVLNEWGIGKRIRRGTGIVVLFDGEPGTGKTHSAEAIAKELNLSMMRINIATMVDKYIGETEKNLTTIFEQARPDMNLLLFDEADSLFTKRTAKVSRSTDRYSNMNINVLLQLIERYEGICVLTTNLKVAIDPAFERRITYKVYFPMPKQPERKKLWEYLCPSFIKTSEPIDYEWLSELELSGGEIKNAVLTAAYKAATAEKELNTDYLYDAGINEAAAAGRVTRRIFDDDTQLQNSYFE